MRNILCSRYDRCLTHAARINRTDFECRGCRYERNHGNPIRFHEVESAILLLWALFRPDVWDLYTKLQRVERRHRAILTK